MRLDPKERTDSLLAAAVALAETEGWQRLTRESIALAAEVSPALVSARLGTMVETRRLVMRYAIRIGNLSVLAQGLAMCDKHAGKAPLELRQRAAQWLASER